jgi:hypothetical protein
MIITRLLGGLGNQMFQYAAGLALAERRRTVLKLDVGWFREDPEHAEHNRYGLSCFNITEQFATREEVDRVRGRPFRRSEDWLRRVAGSLGLRRIAEMHTHGGHWHSQKGFWYYPEFFELPDDTYIDGMWQSEKYFGTDKGALLRHHFTIRYPDPDSMKRMTDRIRSGPSAFVHFRRGDYLSKPRFKREIGSVGNAYYNRAIETLLALHPDVKLYVFSDAIDEVKEFFKPDAPHVFVEPDASMHLGHTLSLMSLCDHAVISNSTFAWWAAWLNPRPDKVVIAPEPWLAGKPEESSGVVPQGWIRLPGGH